VARSSGCHNKQFLIFNHIITRLFFWSKSTVFFKRRPWHQKPYHVRSDYAAGTAFRGSEQFQTQVHVCGWAGVYPERVPMYFSYSFHYFTPVLLSRPQFLSCAIRQPSTQHSGCNNLQRKMFLSSQSTVSSSVWRLLGYQVRHVVHETVYSRSGISTNLIHFSQSF
jgi:hypothetical protein